MVVPSLGSFVPGWVLLVSKVHYTRIADLPVAWIEELERLKGEIGQALLAAFGPYVCFEHGPLAGVSQAGCCVDHVHLHMVPASVNLNKILQLHFTPYPLHSLKDLRGPTFQLQAYLAFEDTRGVLTAYLVGPIPSQFMRQLLAAEIGLLDRYDWRQYPGSEEVLQTITRLQANLKSVAK